MTVNEKRKVSPMFFATYGSEVELRPHHDTGNKLPPTVVSGKLVPFHFNLPSFGYKIHAC